MNKEEIERWSINYGETHKIVQKVEDDLREAFLHPHNHDTVAPPCFHCLANSIVCYVRNEVEESMVKKIKGEVKGVMGRMTK